MNNNNVILTYIKTNLIYVPLLIVLLLSIWCFWCSTEKPGMRFYPEVGNIQDSILKIMYPTSPKKMPKPLFKFTQQYQKNIEYLLKGATYYILKGDILTAQKYLHHQEFDNIPYYLEDILIARDLLSLHSTAIYPKRIKLYFKQINDLNLVERIFQSPNKEYLLYLYEILAIHFYTTDNTYVAKLFISRKEALAETIRNASAPGMSSFTNFITDFPKGTNNLKLASFYNNRGATLLEPIDQVYDEKSSDCLTKGNIQNILKAIEEFNSSLMYDSIFCSSFYNKINHLKNRSRAYYMLAWYYQLKDTIQHKKYFQLAQQDLSLISQYANQGHNAKYYYSVINAGDYHAKTGQIDSALHYYHLVEVEDRLNQLIIGVQGNLYRNKIRHFRQQLAYAPKPMSDSIIANYNVLDGALRYYLDSTENDELIASEAFFNQIDSLSTLSSSEHADEKKQETHSENAKRSDSFYYSQEKRFRLTFSFYSMILIYLVISHTILHAVSSSKKMKQFSYRQFLLPTKGKKKYIVSVTLPQNGFFMWMLLGFSLVLLTKNYILTFNNIPSSYCIYLLPFLVFIKPDRESFFSLENLQYLLFIGFFIFLLTPYQYKTNEFLQRVLFTDLSWLLAACLLAILLLKNGNVTIGICKVLLYTITMAFLTFLVILKLVKRWLFKKNLWTLESETKVTVPVTKRHMKVLFFMMHMFLLEIVVLYLKEVVYGLKDQFYPIYVIIALLLGMFVSSMEEEVEHNETKPFRLAEAVLNGGKIYSILFDSK